MKDADIIGMYIYNIIIEVCASINYVCRLRTILENYLVLYSMMHHQDNCST